jgi:glycosyltransferase involved in cell wall biosynthesis
MVAQKYNPLISVCITSYDAKGMCRYLLNECLRSVFIQDYGNIEVVIGDNNNDKNNIPSVIKNYPNLNIRVIENKGNRQNSTDNWNNCIREARGEIITLMCQDDYYFARDSISKIVEKFSDDKTIWLVSRGTKLNRGVYEDRRVPYWCEKLPRGKNTIGCLSAPSFRASHRKYLDPGIEYYNDCELYCQFYFEYGLPVIIPDVIYVQRIWDGQASNDNEKYPVDFAEREALYMQKKYNLI